MIRAKMINPGHPEHDELACHGSRGKQERLQNITDLGDLRCPRCLGEFEQDQAQLRCRSCAATYKVEDGIVDLRGGRLRYYFNPVPRPEMGKLVAEMSAENWPASIRRFVRHTRNATEWIDNLVVDGRYAWKLLLNLTPDTALLDLGCGLGNLTHNLAPFTRRTYAIDLTYERLAFSRKRFSIFNRSDDIQLIAAGDGARLPFRDAALDCAVLSGVLEWVGEGDAAPFRTGGKLARLWRMGAYQFGARGPRGIQLAFLREIRRVLKPGGQLFVAIENRYNYEYFAGRPDHHSRLKYASLLPRTLANLYSIAVRRSPYRTYTHSLAGYRKLLREAGFPHTEFIGFFRGYSQLNEIVPAAIDLPHWRPEPAQGIKERIQRNPRFVPAYGITASAAPKPWRRLQDELIGCVERDLARSIGPGELLIRRYLIGGKDKLFLRCSYAGRDVIGKIPLNEHALKSEANNSRLLERLAHATTIAGRIPTILGRGSASRLDYFVEASLPGKQLATTMRSDGRTRYIGDVSAMLGALNPVAPELQNLDDDAYERVVGSRLKRVLRHVSDPALHERTKRYFHARLHGALAAFGLFHGDFGSRNLLVHDGRVSGLVDWETGSENGLPLLDALNYLVSAHIACNLRDRLNHAIPLLASGRWPVAEEWELLQQRYAALGMDTSRHDAWTYLYWLHAVDTSMPNHMQYNPAGIEQHVCAVIRTLPEA